MEKSEKSIEKILEAQQKIQKLFPECVLVGGSAVAMKRKHRVSFDADNVMEELKHNFEKILEKLESLSGWKTKRLRPPVLILGRFEGIDVGIRQLIRKKPLEIEIINGIKIPTDKELLRIKAWLIVTRNAVRDYVDFVALCDGMSKEDMLDAMDSFDECYPQPENCEKTSFQLIRMLALSKPYDLTDINLNMYKGIVSPYNSWQYIKKRCKQISDLLFDRLFLEKGDANDPSPYR